MMLIIYVILLILVLLVIFIVSFNRFHRKQDPLNSRRIAGAQYNIYRTSDGQAYFFFRYVRIPYEGYEIDIMSQPSYRTRSNDASVTHRLSSIRPDCNHIICVRLRYAPKTEEAAKKLSMDWAELTWNYIKTGQTIDQQLARR